MNVLNYLAQYLRPHTSTHQAQAGNVIVGVIGIIVIIGIASLIFGGDSPEEPEKTTVDIVINDAKDDRITTKERVYSLSASVGKTSYDIQDIKGTLNGNPTVLASDYQSGENHYTVQLPLLPGDNSFSINVFANNFGEQSSEIAKKEITIHLTATEKPTLLIKNAIQDGANWVVNDHTKDTFDLSVSTKPETSDNSSASSLQINEEVLNASTTGGGYSHKLEPLKDGVNTFTITAKNEAGEVSGTLTINKLSTAEQNARAAVQSVLFEADVSCKAYAEKQLLVKDINVHLDQSSIRRQQADGTILIKANIADSQGFWKPEIPLGIMECTTDPTGILVLNFEHY